MFLHIQYKEKKVEKKTLLHSFTSSFTCLFALSTSNIQLVLGLGILGLWNHDHIAHVFMDLAVWAAQNSPNFFSISFLNNLGAQPSVTEAKIKSGGETGAVGT